MSFSLQMTGAGTIERLLLYLHYCVRIFLKRVEDHYNTVQLFITSRSFKGKRKPFNRVQFLPSQKSFINVVYVLL